MKGQCEKQPETAKVNLLTRELMFTHSINSLPCCTPEEWEQMEVSREKRVIRGMALRGKERATVRDTALSAGKHLWIQFCARRNIPAVLSWKRSRSQRLCGILLLQCNTPPAQASQETCTA